MSRKSKLVVLELALLLAAVVIGTRTAAAQGTLTADKDRLIGAWHLASNKVALVTGAGAGMGLAAAQAFAAEGGPSFWRTSTEK